MFPRAMTSVVNFQPQEICFSFLVNMRAARARNRKEGFGGRWGLLLVECLSIRL